MKKDEIWGFRKPHTHTVTAAPTKMWGESASFLSPNFLWCCFCLFPRFYVPSLPQSSNARSTQCMLKPWGIVYQLIANVEKKSNNKSVGRRLTYNRGEEWSSMHQTLWVSYTKGTDKCTAQARAYCTQCKHWSAILYTEKSVVCIQGKVYFWRCKTLMLNGVGRSCLFLLYFLMLDVCFHY